MQTTNPKDYIELIEAYSIAITHGLIDKSEIVKWADKIIQNDAEPDIFIIELSLCEHKSSNDIITLISDFLGANRPNVPGRVFLGLLYIQYLNNQIAIRQVIDFLNTFILYSDISSEEKSLIYGIDEDYDAALDGIYSSPQQIENEIKAFLEIYKDFRFDNFNDWLEIDKTIDAKVQSFIADTNTKSN